MTASAPVREKITFDDAEALQVLCGQSGRTLKLIEREAGAALHLRGNEITIEGDAHAVALARGVMQQLYEIALRGAALESEDVVRAVTVLRADKTAQLRSIFSDTVLVPRTSRPITPKGLTQKRYVDAVRESDVVFAIGPAGTGKTYLAMAMAVRALLEKQIKRIVLTRPAVEAGERLGFLPGSLEEKVNPYLRPLYDALNDMMDIERASRMIEKGVIEVAPLAFMRGRTLNDSFVILDEAQNSTTEQMRMFLTRLGFGSKLVVTGDVTQSDLPNNVRPGLVEASRILAAIEGIRFVYFTEADVVRHRLVQEIIKAYDREDVRRTAARRPAGTDAPAGNEPGGRDP